MTAPPWLTIAWPELGQRERPGSATNQRISAYFRDAGHPSVGDDETAWCAAFVGAVLERSGHRSSRSLMARSYLTWGVAADASAIGAIAVLSRGSDPSLGHVGFLIATTPETVVILGGNQSNAVTVEAFDRERVLALRWPKATVLDAAAPQRVSEQPSGFDAALSLILRHEGGWSDDPFDPGGATNKGITLAVFARELGREISSDTIAELKSGLRTIPATLVRRIYLDRYWLPARCPELPAALALFHFDTAVNMGVGTAARMLQQALGVESDGDIGPVTLAAAAQRDPAATLSSYATYRRNRYRSLSHFWRFGRGWLARVEASLVAAQTLLASPSQTAVPSNQRKPDPMPTDLEQPQLPTISSRQPHDPVAAPASGDAKWWGESMTIWGALLTAVTTVAPVVLATFGIEMPASLLRQLGTDAITAFQAIAGFVGTVMTITGRIRASRPLETRRLTVRF